MKINEIIEKARAQGRSLLYADEATAILRSAGIPVNHSLPATDEEAVLAAAAATGYPVALKVRSAVLAHKADVGGVSLGLTDPEGLRRAYRSMLKKIRPLDPAAAVTVEPMAAPGAELFVGMTTDPQFGPVLAFGLGGTFLELFNDTTFRMVPLTRADAAEMLKSIKGAKILQGFRGQPALDQEALTELLLNLSQLVEQNPTIKAIDLNPILAYPKGALAVDARMVVE